VPDSREDHVDQQSGGNRANVGPVHGDGRVGFDDSRDHHVTAHLLVHNAKESSDILQGYDASLGDCARYSFEVTVDLLKAHCLPTFNKDREEIIDHF